MLGHLVPVLVGVSGVPLAMRRLLLAIPLALALVACGEDCPPDTVEECEFSHFQPILVGKVIVNQPIYDCVCVTP